MYIPSICMFIPSIYMFILSIYYYILVTTESFHDFFASMLISIISKRWRC